MTNLDILDSGINYFLGFAWNIQKYLIIPLEIFSKSALNDFKSNIFNKSKIGYLKNIVRFKNSDKEDSEFFSDKEISDNMWVNLYIIYL